MGKLKLGQLLVLMASACGMYGQDFDKMLQDLIEGSVHIIQPDSLNALRKNQTDLILLDARAKEEFDVSHLQGAIWVGYDDFDIEQIDIDKEKEIVVYCSVGYRSEKIGEKLNEAGYQHVHNLYGGIFSWKNKGYDVVDPSGKETEKVHPYNTRWGKWLTNGEKSYE